MKLKEEQGRLTIQKWISPAADQTEQIQGKPSSSSALKREAKEDEHLMEKVINQASLAKAIKKVVKNGGVPGIDGMSVTELEKHFMVHGERIVKELLDGGYKPLPLIAVKIPKETGGIRTIFIPTAQDRAIQAALVQALTPLFEPLYSEHSYGYRPKRTSQQAIIKAKQYIDEGYKICSRN